MPKVIASAPGKVTLFGEHAIVYGYPAIVTSIDRRVYVTSEPRNDNTVKIMALDLRVPGIIVTYKDNEVIVGTDYGQSLSAVAYLNKAVEIVSEYLNVRKGVNLIVRSEMPVGAGLGTSASVSVATIVAYAKSMGYDLSPDEVASLGWRVEKEVQGIASPMDTSIATYGGILKIQATLPGKYVREKLNVETELPIVIGYVERTATTKEMVEMFEETDVRILNPDGSLIEMPVRETVAGLMPKEIAFIRIYIRDSYAKYGDVLKGLADTLLRGKELRSFF